MEIYRQTLPIPAESVTLIRNTLDYAPEEVCFFDIETTGLSAKISNVYLIGAAFLRGDTVELIQWFADDYYSEESLLKAFSDALASCSVVLHYNSSTFDVPYLEKKYIDHRLPSPFVKLDSLDIYRRVNSKKHIFRQKTVSLSRWRSSLALTADRISPERSASTSTRNTCSIDLPIAMKKLRNCEITCFPTMPMTCRGQLFALSFCCIRIRRYTLRP